jgi:hypothetical protein
LPKSFPEAEFAEATGAPPLRGQPEVALPRGARKLGYGGWLQGGGTLDKRRRKAYAAWT